MIRPSKPPKNVSPGNLYVKGPPVAQERGCAVADGDVDPITGELFAEMAAAKQGGKGEGKGEES